MSFSSRLKGGRPIEAGFPRSPTLERQPSSQGGALKGARKALVILGSILAIPCLMMLRLALLDGGRYQPLAECPTLADDTLRSFGVTGPKRGNALAHDAYASCGWGTDPAIEIGVSVSNKDFVYSAPYWTSELFKTRTKHLADPGPTGEPGRTKPISGLGDEAVAAYLPDIGLMGLYVRNSNAMITVFVRSERPQGDDEFARFQERAPELYREVAGHLRPR
jgi:hypothetical protein